MLMVPFDTSIIHLEQFKETPFDMRHSQNRQSKLLIPLLAEVVTVSKALPIRQCYTNRKILWRMLDNII